MGFYEAIILAVVQGATEFLPISSSGHLMLAERFFGFQEPNILMSLVLHFGTLLAVMYFYRRDLFQLLGGVGVALRKGVQTGSIGAFQEEEGARLAVLLILAMIPTGVLGILLYPYVSTSALEDTTYVPHIILGSLIITGFLLFSARFFRDEKIRDRSGGWTVWNISPAVALGIGVAQGMAVLPGFSRSGLTIVAALWLWVYREKAARFSFLLSIPAVFGALCLEILKSIGEAGGAAITVVDLGIYVSAAAVAGIVGYLSILWLVKMLEKAKFWHFSWYCWVVGVGGLAFLML